MTIKAVYRSRDPRVLEIWRRWVEEETAYLAALDEVIEEIRPTPTAEPMVGGVFGRPHLVGFSYSWRDEPPVGWRYDRKQGMVVPRRGTKAGKEIAAKLDELVPPDPREALPGMPTWFIAPVDNGYAAIRAGLREYDGTVIATWEAPFEVVESHKVDLSVWDRWKLSEYYALLESIDEADDEATG